MTAAASSVDVAATPWSVDVVLPNDIDDPTGPSGGNRYDREVCTGLAALGWSVREHPARGAWPAPSPDDLAALGRRLTTMPTGSPVLVDGLVASAAPDTMAAHAGRLRLVVLVHMPFGDTDAAARPGERRALGAATAVIATSEWTRRRLIELYPLPPVTVATPGVAAAAVAPGTGTGGALLSVAVLGPHKGQDVLVEALTRIAGRARGRPPGWARDWTWVCAGALDRDPAFVRALRSRVDAAALTGRVHFPGPRTGASLDALYAAADLLVHPSRGETYGMVAAEALARGIPVLATTAKGLPDAVGRAETGIVPGLLVPPDDPEALAAALERWLGDHTLRQTLRAAALSRRSTLTDWSVTAGIIADTLRNLPASMIAF
ncbi:glycosyltransferase family 4 protein [Dactylosporangium sp. CA-139066]|uniref:glycosyltransferase family 4 protein n=1 Tax=Dactylosporangium sp. CA-139066 TaxID=3239930 RepID=UPI003D8DFCCD